ncbi:hypothetical protein D3C85_98300 [compost metagenome]
MLLARAADRHGAQGGHRRSRYLRWGPVAARTPLTGERGFLIGSVSGGCMLLAPGRRPARCPGWPPAERVDPVHGTRWVSACGGPRVADRVDAQSGHRRGGWIRCTAPGGSVPAAGPRAADRLDAQGCHRRGRYLLRGLRVADQLDVSVVRGAVAFCGETYYLPTEAI